MMFRNHRLFGLCGLAVCCKGILGKDSSSTTEDITQEQVAGQGGGAGSSTIVAGAGSRNAGNSGLAIGGSVNVAKNATVDISNPDPEAVAILGQTAQDALTEAQTVAESAEDTAVQSEGITGTVATSAINEVGDLATNLESLANNYANGLLDAAQGAETVANNGITGNGQPIQTEYLPNPVQGTYSNSGGNLAGIPLGTWATWIAIASGLLAIWYYLVKKK